MSFSILDNKNSWWSVSCDDAGKRNDGSVSERSLFPGELYIHTFPERSRIISYTDFSIVLVMEWIFFILDKRDSSCECFFCVGILEANLISLFIIILVVIDVSLKRRSIATRDMKE